MIVSAREVGVVNFANTMPAIHAWNITLYGMTIISEIYFDWNLKFIWYAFYVIETNWNNDNDENVFISISGKYLLNIFY